MKYYRILALAAVCVLAGLFRLSGEFVYYFRNFAAAAVFAVVYLGFGIKLQKVFKISMPEIKYPMAFVFSLGVMGTLFFLAGFAGLYNPVFAYAVIVMAAVICYKEIGEMFLEAAAYLKNFRPIQAGPWDVAVFAALGAVFLYLFFLCLTPPVYYDTLVYHLAVPQQYIEAGRILNMKENIFSYYPQIMQMNALFMLLLSDELSVKLLYFFTALMSMAALSALAGEIKADKKTAVLLAAACPLFVLNASRIGAELPLMFFTLLFVYILLKVFSSGLKNMDALLAGILAGMIMSVKYTGAVVYIFGAAVFIYLLAVKRAGWISVLTYLAVPGVIVLPYLARNYIFTGDLLYPFFTGFFRMEQGLSADASLYVSHVKGFGVPHSVLNLLMSPVHTLFNPGLFGGDVISPLLLIALIVLPLTNLKKTALPVIFAVFYFIAWFFTGQVLRFLLPVVPLAALIAGQAFANTKPAFKYLALGLLVAAQAGTSLYFGEKYLEPFQMFVLNRNEYKDRYLSYYRAADFINTSTDRDAGVLLLGDARTFYIKRPVLAYTVFNSRGILDNLSETKGEGFIASLLSRKIRYILLNRNELYRLKESGFNDVDALVKSEAFNKVMDNYFKKIYSDANCDVYELLGR